MGYSILGQGVGSLLWNPLSRSIGRRPTYLIASFIYMPMVIWECQAKSYGSFCAARVFTGLTAAWSQTIPPTSIADIYVVEVRGRKMATYSIPNLIGPVIAPVFGALIVNVSSWRNQFWLNFGMAALQFALIFFLVPETMWNENTNPPTTAAEIAEADKRDVAMIETPAAPVSAHAGHVGPAFMPWKNPGAFFKLVVAPLEMMRYFNISLTSFYCGMCFGFLSLGMTVPTPQVLEAAPFNFALVPAGCSYLAFAIGGVLGKWSGGIVGDKISSYFERRNGQRQPEDRVWAAYPILPLMFIGHMLTGLALHFGWHWMVLLVGGGIAFFALSAITVLQTYCMESYLARSMDTMFVWNFWKCIWGFVVPFFIMEWGEKWGWLAADCTQGAFMAGLGLVTCAFLIWKGYNIRVAQNMPYMEKH